MSAQDTMPYLKSSLLVPVMHSFPHFWHLLSPLLPNKTTANPKVWFKNPTELLVQEGKGTLLKPYLYAVKQCSFSVFQTASSKSFLDLPIKSHGKSIQEEYYYLAEKARLLHTVEEVLTGVKWEDHHKCLLLLNKTEHVIFPKSVMIRERQTFVN